MSIEARRRSRIREDRGIESAAGDAPWRSSCAPSSSTSIECAAPPFFRAAEAARACAIYLGARPRGEALLALLGALAALGLRLAEERDELGVAGSFGVVDEDLEAQRVAEAGAPLRRPPGCRSGSPSPRPRGVWGLMVYKPVSLARWSTRRRYRSIAFSATSKSPLRISGQRCWPMSPRRSSYSVRSSSSASCIHRPSPRMTALRVPAALL